MSEALVLPASQAPSSVAAHEPAARAAAPWRRAFDDLGREHGFVPLRIEGSLPFELAGTIYRNGPGLLSSFDARYDRWTEGDGVVSAVRIERGKAAGAVRVVESPGLLEERRLQRRLFSGYGTRSPRPMREHLFGRTKNRANVTVVAWCGRLFALGGGCPIEMSPEDLATLGEVDPEDLGVTAIAPHVRHLESRRATFAAQLIDGRRPALDILRLPNEGVAERIARVPLRVAGPVHDFAATTRHLVFCIPPRRVRTVRLALGLGSQAENEVWDAASGTEILVVPIDDPTQAVRFVVDAFLPLHTCNAFERGGEIVLDLVTSPDPTSVDRYYASLPAGRADGAPASGFTRIVLDLRRRTARSDGRAHAGCELPRVAPLAEGEAYRRAWMIGRDAAGGVSGGPADRLLAVDVENGHARDVDLGPDQYPSEPVPVPKARATGEDDVRILADVYDARRHATHLAVLDGSAPHAGPIARVHFDHHVPPSFHGTWCPRRAR